MKKEELLKRLETIKKLEDNWDNYGADPINKTVIKNTKILIDNLRILPDFIAPIAWGAIQLEWERKNLNETGTGVFNGEFGTILDINEKDKNDYLFKEIVLEIDPDAFFVINDCYEVQGGQRRNLPHK